jgi:hypothetical protein
MGFRTEISTLQTAARKMMASGIDAPKAVTFFHICS